MNLKMDGVRFETAALVFNDENRIEFYDSAHSLFEDRYNTIGMAGKVIFVVYTERRNSAIRIISARLATAAERRLYHAGQILPETGNPSHTGTDRGD